MAINKFDAGYYASESYKTDGGTALSGWTKLTTSIGEGITGSGYFSVAYVKVVSGVATDVVIAHRGTENLADAVSDMQLAIGVATTQTNDAIAFKNAVGTSYTDFLAANPQYTGGLFTDITTNVGHSLGGYLRK